MSDCEIAALAQKLAAFQGWVDSIMEPLPMPPDEEEGDED